MLLSSSNDEKGKTPNVNKIIDDRQERIWDYDLFIG
jgi:hypothetical protein